MSGRVEFMHEKLMRIRVDNARKFLNQILIADHDLINLREIISVFDIGLKRG